MEEHRRRARGQGHGLEPLKELLQLQPKVRPIMMLGWEQFPEGLKRTNNIKHYRVLQRQKESMCLFMVTAIN